MSGRRWLVVTVSALLLASGCYGDSQNDTTAGEPNAQTPIAPQNLPPDASGTPSGTLPRPDKYLSTFALDVDTASYGFARRSILDGRKPDPSAIRPEEFVNHFRQDYAQPQGSGFSVTADGGRTGPDTRLLRVGLQTRDSTNGLRRDSNLTFVIDTSGSMGEPGRLDLVKDALTELVNQLRPTDAVALVTYSDDARIVQPMTPISRKTELVSAIEELAVSGSTNLEAGMTLGYREARRAFRPEATNRVILASDGLANTGATTSAPILRQVSEEASKEITLLCVGVGSDYGDKLMEELADKGDGRAVYVSDPVKARQLFVHQLPATIEVRARDAKAQISFDPETVASYRLIGYDNRALSSSEFRDDQVDGGEIGPGHSVTALYAVQLKPGADGHLADVNVRWQDPDTYKPSEVTRPVTVSDLSPDLWAQGKPRLRVSAAAAYFAEYLIGTSDGQETETVLVTQGLLPGEPRASLALLEQQVRSLATVTEDKDVRELADLIAAAD